MNRYLPINPKSMTLSDLLAIGEPTGELRETPFGLEGIIQWLADASIAEIAEIQGVGPSRARLIKAALELGKMAATQSRPQPETIASPADVAGFLMPRMRYMDRESFLVVMLNTKNHIRGLHQVSIGTLNSCPVHPREVFKPAIRASAAAVILAHNHPSGDPTPSDNDVRMTSRLVKVGDLIGIEVLDHVVIGHDTYYSFRERGMMTC